MATLPNGNYTPQQPLRISAASPHPLIANLQNDNKWTTPKRLQIALAAIGIAAMLLFFTALNAISQTHKAIKTVGQDSAPSIIAAQQIKAGLADMDADVANELIAPPGKDGPEIASYEQHRKQVTDSLIAAAENVTYGDKELVPIRTMNEALGQYEAYVAQSRVFHKRGGDPQVLPSYHQASEIMHNTLLPAADNLDNANNSMLEIVYNQQKATDNLLISSVWFIGLLAILVLAAIQIYLARTMRRLINIPLAAATFICLCFVVYTTSALSQAKADLKVAKEDAFDSISALSRAKAVSYDANAAESRWLLDPGYAKASSTQFFESSNKLGTQPNGETYDSLAEDAKADKLPQEFQGYFATELRNITFPGEKDAAINMVQTFSAYFKIDAQIRQLENDGKHADAVNLCVGTAQGQSNWAFDQYDKALQSVIDINMNYFNSSVAKANADINNGIVVDAIACVAIFALSAAGLIVRLREYTI